MAARLIKEDAPMRKDRLRRAEEARRVLSQEFATLGSSVDVGLRQRITNIHANAAALEGQSKALRSRAGALAKSTRIWGGVADGARMKLKELGDVQNWAEMVEHELLVIEETLRIVHEEGGGDGEER